MRCEGERVGVPVRLCTASAQYARCVRDVAPKSDGLTCPLPGPTNVSEKDKGPGRPPIHAHIVYRDNAVGVVVVGA